MMSLTKGMTQLIAESELSEGCIYDAKEWEVDKVGGKRHERRNWT